jgi:MYXO-CTERM domain-containing protein
MKILAPLVLILSTAAWAQRSECANSLGTNCAAAIPERGTLTSTLTVLPGACAADARIVDVDVRVQLAHTAVGDLNLTLVHPSGRAVQFLYRVGLGLAPVTDSCLFDDLDATFDDEASAIATCDFTIPAVTGSLRPFNPLSSFDGLERNGVWQLQVNDALAEGTGALNGWSIDLPCSLPAVSVGTGVRDSIEGSGEAATVVFTREGSTDAGLDVPYELSGTALPGADFERPTGRVSFAPGEATATLRLVALADGLAETTESVIVTLGTGAFSAGAVRSAGVNLVDVTCGDGVRTGMEACDDGNQQAGDGCNAACEVEPAPEPVPEPEPTKPSGCGCAAVEPVGALLLVGLWLRRRRR